MIFKAKGNRQSLTNSGEQQGQDKNNTDTTLKTKKQMNNMDPTKKPGVDSGAPEEYAGSASCKTPAMLLMSNLV